VLSKSLRAIALSCAIFLTSCTKFNVKDKEFCWDAGALGAACQHTIDQDLDRDIPKEDWDKLRLGWACISEEDVGELKLFFGDLCSRFRCNKETREKMASFFQRVETRIKPKVRAARRWRK